MREDGFYEDSERSSSGFLVLMAGLAFLFAVGALAWIYLLQARLSHAEADLRLEQKHNVRLMAQQAEMRRELHATSDAFGEKVGIAQHQIAEKAQELLRQQQAASHDLALQQDEIRRQVGSVTNAVSTVKSDVGGVKQELATNTRDVATTRKELASTQQQLQAAIGDMGVQSGLIAKNSTELEYLKQLGNRNYFPFTLHKGRTPVNVSTIRLQLRKTDAKHARFTLTVFADDRKMEKKNREVDEPLQFYTGKQPALYEVVVNEVGKGEVSGYLSTPKLAPKLSLP